MRLKSTIFTLLILGIFVQACNSHKDAIDNDGSEVIQSFVPYQIEDSSKIINFPSGLQLYIVESGPGKFPENGNNVRMEYYGTLKDGTVFDESFSRKEVFEFRVGSKNVIEGMQEAIKNMRYGSKAIAIIPPELGYGDGVAQGHNDKHLPSNIPPNSTLTFHIDLLGTF